ncbi:hypothetical protein L873DRAFT_1786233 [Choiromyces venosus 120613-1]|uniref:Uncharacterized protein n=1 Tax=Choiromyces venosus 120613-1 TaxID=1336337 RepID=A0A3N4K7J1_9PEZI|nr:hypothetical protein L873DRAFT_1786233 [Choiromyces venosus 120613-1]
MAMNSFTGRNSAAGHQDMSDFITLESGKGTPVPPSPNPTLIHLNGQQLRRKRSRSIDDGDETDSESEVRARKANFRITSYSLERHLSEQPSSSEAFLYGGSSYEECQAKRGQEIQSVFDDFDRKFMNPAGDLTLINTNSTRSGSSDSMSISGSSRISGSTGTTTICGDHHGVRLGGILDDLNYTLNQYLIAPLKDDPFVGPAIMDEGEGEGEEEGQEEAIHPPAENCFSEGGWSPPNGCLANPITPTTTLTVSSDDAYPYPAEGRGEDDLSC